MRIGDYFGRVEKILGAETVAGGAGADGTVEREQPRLQFAQGIIANRAGKFIGEHEFRALRIVHIGDARHSLAQS
jgi:hypothetical protein